MRPTGYIQDFPDQRDQIVEKTHRFGFARPPESYAGLADSFDILLKQEAESCVGFAIAEALYASWRAQGIRSPAVPSPLFIWWNSRKAHHAERINVGTHIRTALRSTTKLGFCSDSVYQGTNGFDASFYMTKPTRAAYRFAYDQRLTSLEYYRVKGLGEERRLSWKRALSGNNPIVFGVPVTAPFFDHRGDGYISSPPIDAEFAGGHAMCALGYNDEGVYGPQTWGDDWGANGWFRLSWDYVLDWALDQWALHVPPYFSEV